MVCDFCKKEYEHLDYNCKFCKKGHCAKHRLPENHDCVKFDDNILKKGVKDYSKIPFKSKKEKSLIKRVIYYLWFYLSKPFRKY